MDKIHNAFKILIVSQYYYPDVTAAAFRIKDIGYKRYMA
jgi:hypothetical protein